MQAWSCVMENAAGAALLLPPEEAADPDDDPPEAADEPAELIEEAPDDASDDAALGALLDPADELAETAGEADDELDELEELDEEPVPLLLEHALTKSAAADTIDRADAVVQRCDRVRIFMAIPSSREVQLDRR